MTDHRLFYSSVEVNRLFYGSVAFKLPVIIDGLRLAAAVVATASRAGMAPGPAAYE